MTEEQMKSRMRWLEGSLDSNSPVYISDTSAPYKKSRLSELADIRIELSKLRS
jgi:hypothetical protein